MMKLVKNSNYGGFGYGVAEEYKKFVRECEDDRTNAKLVEFVENNEDDCGDLEVVELPDNTTDYLIEDYDGFETIYYVVDGKIHTV